MSDIKRIAGTPAERDMVRPFGLAYIPAHESGYSEAIVALTVPDGYAEGGNLHLARAEHTIEQFYELREAVNDLYDHIRQDV